ncbi:GIN domain-containing protein [Capnocytophaga granulosa]
MRTIKNLFLQSFFFLLSCCRPVIGNKKIVFQERTVSAYSQIKILGNADIVLTDGNIGQIKVETSENVLSYVTTEVKGDILVIKLKHYGVNYVPKLKVYVPIDEKFNKITIVGKAEVISKEDFSLQLPSLEVVLKGNGNFKGKALSARKAILSIAGAGNIEISVTEEVQAKIMGYGHITIFGNPSKKDTDIKGSGKIQFL